MTRAHPFDTKTEREEALEILALHNGDALEALRTMIAERDAVEERLAIATMIVRENRVFANALARHG